MKQKIYSAPQCTKLIIDIEKLICLSIPIGPGPGPGGGGQAKENPFNRDEADENLVGNNAYSAWED